ncbi:Protein phosphatase, putative [Hondaea fermentalgiana]|uniref:Protein phosphatase, putative n=1 Tax=Hondaea fermentalgiana TaxID=2315210 RepID=A0A2R5GP73_9STRA|nr:Protein phosphatase, putative [Hondaea fermentalgiana]|eukprot:GBG30423.1 Protein phosphatase, putative [Hondaea fermentalgiana]
MASQVPALALATGVCERIGKRKSMEDATSVFCALSTSDATVEEQLTAASAHGERRKSVELSVEHARDNVLGCFGVFDGHGGIACADYCSVAIPQLLASHEKTGTDAELALLEVFAETDKRLREYLDRNFADTLTYQSGCTASVVVMSGRYDDKITLTCANVGDTRTLLVRRDGSYIPLSHDHVPHLESEKLRIENAGGFVAPPPMRADSSSVRVLGSLAVTRSLGDFAFKLPKVASWGTPEKPITEDLVSGIPDIKQQEIYPNDQLLLIACDGIWDVFSRTEAAEFVRKGLNAVDKDPEARCKSAVEKCDQVAAQLIEEAISRGTKDNCSCVLVRIFPRSKSRMCAIS